MLPGRIRSIVPEIDGGFGLTAESVRMNTFFMSITPQAIQDLLDELEASKQSRLRDYPHALQALWKALDRAEDLIQS
jgi:hypothetical protein